MTANVIIVCGTGTEIGKTHFSVALLEHAGRSSKTLGYKPVESGCLPWASGSDHVALAAASTFHVKQPPLYCFATPVSPHLAARREAQTIDVARIADRIVTLAVGPELLLIELAGGLFSPLSEVALNCDLLRELQRRLPDALTLLVAPDRLGVLHDLGATTRAALVGDVKLDAVILSTPASADASTGTNASELAALIAQPVLATLPRAAAATLANGPGIGSIYSFLLSNLSRPASMT